MDFINKGMLFAAILLLCFFPFLIVASALAGRSAVNGIALHLGLNHRAAMDMSKAFAPPSSTSAAISGTGYVFFIFGGIAAATAVQDLYERAFELESKGMKDTLRRIVWLGVVIGLAFGSGLVGRSVHHAIGPVGLALLGFIVFTGFWWLTMRLLLGRRVHWRALLPSAIATGVCWVGMTIVFKLTFSSMVIDDYKKYGAIGVAFALMSWLIAIGVVIILGAVVGVVWRERELSFVGAFRRLFHR